MAAADSGSVRLVLHEWQKQFPKLASGPDAALEAKLGRSIAIGRSVASRYWLLILTTAFLGAAKPF